MAKEVKSLVFWLVLVPHQAGRWAWGFLLLHYCRWLMEAAGWKSGTTNEPQSEVPDFFSFSFDGILGIDSRFLPRSLSQRLLVTSKITTRNTYVKAWMTSTREQMLTERHTEYNSTNTMCRCARLHRDNPTSVWFLWWPSLDILMLSLVFVV